MKLWYEAQNFEREGFRRYSTSDFPQSKYFAFHTEFHDEFLFTSYSLSSNKFDVFRVCTWIHDIFSYNLSLDVLTSNFCIYIAKFPLNGYMKPKHKHVKCYKRPLTNSATLLTFISEWFRRSVDGIKCIAEEFLNESHKFIP